MLHLRRLLLGLKHLQRRTWNLLNMLPRVGTQTYHMVSLGLGRARGALDTIVVVECVGTATLLGLHTQATYVHSQLLLLVV